METGCEWVIDAFGCEAESLRSSAVLAALFGEVVRDLDLRPLGDAVWHVFPGAGGITGFLLLSESHLACHTFPEHGHAALDLYCCRPRAPWPWSARLAALLGAREVRVRAIPRGAP